MAHPLSLTCVCSLALLAACGSAPEAADVPPDQAPVVIAIEGAESVSAEQLRRVARAELAQFGRRGRRAADLDDAAFKMSLLFHESGFAHAEVGFSQEAERVVFTVKENARTYLGDVRFSGAASLTERELADAFGAARAREHDGRPVFVLSAVRGGAGSVESLYKRRGHYRARVEVGAVRWNASRTIADVDISIAEGKRYRIAEARVEGEVAPELAGIVSALKEQVFNVVLPFAAAARIRGRLLDAGHRQPVVRPEIRIDDENATVEVVMHVDPGAVHRLRGVKVTGLDRTRERFVRTRVSTQPGEVIREKDLAKAREDLYETNLFKRVRIESTVAGEDEADIEVEIEEYLARSVGVKAGWASYELLRGSVLYQDLNFGGRGQILTLEVGGSMKGWGAEASFRDKYVLGPRWDIAFGGGYEFREEPTFDRTSVHAALTFIHELARWVRDWPARPRALDLTLGYLYDAQKASNVTGAIPLAEQGDFVVSAGLLGHIDYDSLDDPLIPTTGVLGRFGLFWSAPVLGAELDYLEVSFRLAGHTRLGPSTVLGAGLRFRTRSPLDGSPTLPVQQRLFLGGADSVRSFRQDLLSPTDAAGQPLGGLTAAEFTVELRQLITGNLHAAVFYDVGTVGSSPWSFASEPGHAIGFGVRYYLPVGPIRLDVGYNPGMLFGMTARWTVHFAIGFSF